MNNSDPIGEPASPGRRTFSIHTSGRVRAPARRTARRTAHVSTPPAHSSRWTIARCQCTSTRPASRTSGSSSDAHRRGCPLRAPLRVASRLGREQPIPLSSVAPPRVDGLSWVDGNDKLRARAADERQHVVALACDLRAAVGTVRRCARATRRCRTRGSKPTSNAASGGSTRSDTRP